MSAIACPFSNFGLRPCIKREKGRSTGKLCRSLASECRSGWPRTVLVATEKAWPFVPHDFVFSTSSLCQQTRIALAQQTSMVTAKLALPWTLESQFLKTAVGTTAVSSPSPALFCSQACCVSLWWTRVQPTPTTPASHHRTPPQALAPFHIACAGSIMVPGPVCCHVCSSFRSLPQYDAWELGKCAAAGIDEWGNKAPLPCSSLEGLAYKKLPPPPPNFS